MFISTQQNKKNYEWKKMFFLISIIICVAAILLLCKQRRLPKNITSFFVSPTPTSTPTPTPTLTPTPTNTPTPTLTPSPLPTPTPTLTPTSFPTTSFESYFDQYSTQYQVSKELLKKIAFCESGINPSSTNGEYGGMYQFTSETWQTTRTFMGLDTNPDLRFNAEEAIKTAAYKIANGGQSAWTNCL